MKQDHGPDRPGQFGWTPRDDRPKKAAGGYIPTEGEPTAPPSGGSAVKRPPRKD